MEFLHVVKSDAEIILEKIDYYKQQGIVCLGDRELYFYEDNTVISIHEDGFKEVYNLERYEDICFIINLIEEL